MLMLMLTMRRNKREPPEQIPVGLGKRVRRVSEEQKKLGPSLG